MTAPREQQRQQQEVVAAAVRADCFSLDQIKSECPAIDADMINQIVNELTVHGWLYCQRNESGLVYLWQRRNRPFDCEDWLNRKERGNRLKSTPQHERPRERLLELGAANLRTAELLAILIRSGRTGESALQAGEKLANHFADRLDRIPDAGIGELSSLTPAAGETAFCQIMAGVELGRRVAEKKNQRSQRKERIRSTLDAINFCERHFSRLISDGIQEEFHVVSLDTKNQVIATHQVTVGTLDASLVHPREVFRPAIKDAAASVILVHNHPSGDPTPSPEDLRVTSRLESSGKNLGIDVLDHIILGSPRSISIREFE